MHCCQWSFRGANNGDPAQNFALPAEVGGLVPPDAPRPRRGAGPGPTPWRRTPPIPPGVWSPVTCTRGSSGSGGRPTSAHEPAPADARLATTRAWSCSASTARRSHRGVPRRRPMIRPTAVAVLWRSSAASGDNGESRSRLEACCATRRRAPSPTSGSALLAAAGRQPRRPSPGRGLPAVPGGRRRALRVGTCLPRPRSGDEARRAAEAHASSAPAGLPSRTLGGEVTRLRGTRRRALCSEDSRFDAAGDLPARSPRSRRRSASIPARGIGTCS